MIGATAATAQHSLPEGSAPAPVTFRHFPDRLHAVVWRNWQLVEPARIATALGTTEEKIRAVAASMGLPPVEKVPEAWRRRGYITIVRRNWHLLSYDQLLTLVDMSAEELAVALREDDFLFIKLGSLKPRCEPVPFHEPDEPTRRRAAEIKTVVLRHFSDTLTGPGEPPFHFIETFRRPSGRKRGQSGVDAVFRQAPRFIYSYCATFGDPLSDPRLEAFPEGLLERLSDSGVNGIWLHVVLRQIAPGGPQFPEFGVGHKQRLENLRELVARAKRYGIAVYLYMNEPRSMPNAFFARRPGMAGVAEGDFRAMCTSDLHVRQWLNDSLAYVFRQAPDLGGVFTITASENFTHCASHGNHKGCPRCNRRDPDEIIAEVNTAIATGVRRGNSNARVIIWDWGWHGHGIAPGIIARLPKDSWLMSVSEWSKPIERGGVRTEIGEYCLSAVGPGPRATQQWAFARQAGLKTVAKVQLNVTWELSAVPYLPVMDLVAEHCANLARLKIDGTMLSWSLGGYPSPNLQIAHRFAEKPDANIDEVLNNAARQRYGATGASHARRAWTEFSRAFAEFPYHGQVVYQGPQQFGPANLLFERPTGYRATMVGFPYDDLDGWRGPYPAAVFAAQMEKVARGWVKGVDALKRAVELAPAEKRADAESDLRVAHAAAIHFASVANQTRFVLARAALANSRKLQKDAGEERRQIRQILEREIQLAKELFALAQSDSRLGFEASNHYYYVPVDLVEKVVNCEYLKTQLAAEP
jgi:hypothetical protein